MKAQSDRLKVLEAAIVEEVQYGGYLEDAIKVEEEHMSSHKELGEKFYHDNRVALMQSKEN